MKVARSLAFALILSPAAFAASLIHLHAPQNPNHALFGYDTLCHVQSLDTNTGNWLGVCRYVGYRNVNQYGTVMWDDSGAGTYLAYCRQPTDSTHTGPICPAETYGAFEYVQITDANGTFPVAVFEQGTDSVGVMAVIIDGSPRTSGLVTP